jgi:hypothetical protein
VHRVKIRIVHSNKVGSNAVQIAAEYSAPCKGACHAPQQPF